jgi:hypothetical protein
MMPDFQLDVRLPGAAFPPESTNANQFWLRMARDLIGLSATRRRTRASSALARRDGQIIAAAVDGFPPCVNNSAAREADFACWDGMHLGAEAALVSHAALHGTSLRGSTVYCWPMLNSCHDASLLIAAGVSVIVEPDYQIPASREDARRLIRSMAAEAGVLLVREQFDAIFGAHYEICGEHQLEPSHAPKSSTDQP